MIVLRCDDCKKEVLEVNSFKITYRRVINGDSMSYSNDIELNHRIHLCNECGKKLFDKYNLEVKK